MSGHSQACFAVRNENGSVDLVSSGPASRILLPWLRDLIFFSFLRPEGGGGDSSTCAGAERGKISAVLCAATAAAFTGGGRGMGSCLIEVLSIGRNS
jgi:hypothetical protein